MLKKIIGIVVGICFGSAQVMAAATCNDQAVIDAFVGQYVCSEFFNCGSFGFDYKQLKSASDEEIRRRVKANSTIADAVSQIQKFGSVGSKWADYYENNIGNALVGGKKIIKSANAVAVDFNPNLKRYSCEISFQFDSDSLNAYAEFGMMVALLQNQSHQALLMGGIEGNKEDVVTLYIGIIRGAVGQLASEVEKTASFSVQPKDMNAWFSSDFVISKKQKD